MGTCSSCFEGLSAKSGAAVKAQGFKVCVCGGAGSLGQQLCLLLAMNPLVQELSIYDMEGSSVPAHGVAADLQHLQASCRVRSYTLKPDARPERDLPGDCLQGCGLVLMLTGVPRKHGQDWRDLVRINANITKLMVEACARFCPDAVLGLLVEPLGALVPAMAALYEKKGLDPKKVVGVTTLDAVRVSRLVREATGQPAERSLHIPVVGGSSGRAVVPLFSQDKAARQLPPKKQQEIEDLVQDATSQVVQAKQGKGSAALSAAYAASLFADSVLQGLAGKPGPPHCALVRSNVRQGLQYFTSPLTFGRKGVDQVSSLPRWLSEREKQRLEEAEKLLQAEVRAGLDYAKTNVLLCNMQN